MGERDGGRGMGGEGEEGGKIKTKDKQLGRA